MGRTTEIEKPPRTQKRNGRWFWECTRAVADLGFERSIPLGADPMVAFQKAKEWNRRVELARAGTNEQGEAAEDVKGLISIYKKTDEYRGLSKSTKAQYNSVLGQIEEMAGHVLVGSIRRKGLKKTFKLVRQRRGWATAVNHIRLWRILFEVAIEEEWRPDNPARFKIKHPPARERVWFEHEFEAFCDKAVEVGRPSLKLAALIARDMGPRRFDVCRLPRTAYDREIPAVFYRETKRGKRVPAKITRRLQVEIEAAIADNPGSTQIVICEATRRPYKPSHLSHEVQRVRKLAGLEAPDSWDAEKDGPWKPSWWNEEMLGDYVAPTFHDLRRSLQTELADAGANRDQRGALTGQSNDTLPIYTVPSLEQSTAAVELLEQHRTRKKSTGAG